MTYDEIAIKVDKEIKDEKLKKLLFNKEHPKGRHLQGIAPIYRMLLFSFFFVFSKYKADKKNGTLLAKQPNAERVFDSFSCIYNGENISFDLIMYVLTEVQIDVVTYGKKSYFYQIFSNDDDSLQIPTVRRPIKTWLHSAKLAETDDAKILEWFIGVYDSLLFLRKLTLTEEIIPSHWASAAQVEGKDSSEVSQKITYIYGDNETGEQIPSFNLLFVDSIDGELYYLGSYENTENNMSVLSYYTLEGSNLQRIMVPTREFLRSAYIKNNNALPRSIFAKSLFSIGFKYIKNLAYAVCDTITKATKQKLYEHFSMQYSDIFEMGFNRRLEEINWDNALTILIFEEGPSRILELILDSEGMYFEKILQNLSIRYNDEKLFERVKKSYDEDQAREMEIIKRYVDDQSSIVKNISAVNKTLMAKNIIDGLAAVEKKKEKSNSLFVESLPMRINSITKVTLSRESMIGQVIKINRALEKTFKYVLPFYKGIVAYQKYKENAINEQEARGDVCFDRNLLFEQCEQEFFNAAKQEAENIQRLTLGQLKDAFVEFAKSLYKKEGHRLKVSENGKALKAAIGREYLCSLKTLNNIFTLKSNVVSDDGSLYTKDLVAFINDVKHYKNNLNENVFMFKEFIQKSKELLYYFIYNEDYEREMIIAQQISYDPIYPYVIRYTEKSENRDGYYINSFSVFFDADNGEREIKILSDREYAINEKYYCIPNLTMSNSRWWIEPFLISCRKYDDLISSIFDKNKKYEDEA